MTNLALSNVEVALRNQVVLSDVSLSFPAGSVTTLLGPNGAGKTTALRTAAGLINPNSGQVLIGGKDRAKFDSQKAARLISYLPQSRQVHWSLSARAVVEVGRVPHQGRWAMNSKDKSAVENAMRATHSLSLADRAVDSLSGGERARVLLARALAVDAPILLADEPFAGLDPAYQLEFVEVLREVAGRGVTVVVVVHDFNLAYRLGGNAALLHLGAVTAAGSLDSVLTAEHLKIPLVSESNRRGCHPGRSVFDH